MCGVAVVSKTFMTFGAYTALYNLNPFVKILFDPNRTRPILTGKQHCSVTLESMFEHLARFVTLNGSQSLGVLNDIVSNHAST